MFQELQALNDGKLDKVEYVYVENKVKYRPTMKKYLLEIENKFKQYFEVMIHFEKNLSLEKIQYLIDETANLVSV